MATYLYSLRDFGGELSTLQIRVEEPSEVQLDWETIINANEATVRAAIDGVTLCNIANHYVRVSEEKPNDAQPSSPYAQRESGLRVFYEDDVTGEKANLTIAGPDLASLTFAENSDQIVLADAGPMAALVSALESYMFSAAGNSITVTSAWHVGRNS